ncbi:uncharacterized protein TNCV_4150491 [Trichonephila clavipes]|uniref:Transposase n=1 Tax=Trichonephila clavipes TaxID=2585209 RepID=A0A8X6W5I2_TRICX|nr:uncharacterized protein TNCV_4150491 [Trichonephila clavipes]
MMPTWLYRQHFAMLPLNRHDNNVYALVEVCFFINFPLRNCTRAFGDGPRNSEPRLRDEDEIHAKGKTSSPNRFNVPEPLYTAATRGLLATDHVILNHGQVTWTTPELAPPLLTTTPHQREDVSALDRFNVHRCPTRRVFSGTGLEPVTKQATVRYLYHSATAATDYQRWSRARDFHKRILFSDEAHFWLNGYVNKQNCRIWSEANPQVYVETPLHPEKLTVWCALWAGGILLQKRRRPQRYSQW